MDRLKEIIESYEAEEQYIKEFWDNDIDSIEPEEVSIKESNLKRVKDTITYLKELQRYKDLEEQGGLIISPMPLGKPYYEITKSCNINAFPLRPASAGRIIQNGLFGETVFATKEEAEQKLSELKGTEE